MMTTIAGSRALPAPEEHSLAARSLRRHAGFGVIVMAALILGLGGWAAVTQLAGAVIANGAVVVDGGSRRVQHADPGIVRAIFAKNDDRVEAGQVLVRLDDVAARSQLGVILSQLRDQIATEARLSAESIDAPTMTLPPIVAGWPSDPELASVMGEQEKLRLSRRKSLDSQAAQMDAQMAQKQSEIDGLKAQLDANSRQLDLVRTENAKLEKLFNQGLMQGQTLNDARQNQAKLEGQVGDVTASIASAEASISQLQMQRAQLYIDFRSQVLSDLQTSSQTVGELLQKKIAAEDTLARLDIRAPIAGTVHESIVQTVGGVIQGGDTLMLIVPQDKHLLIDTRVSPLDVDKLRAGQKAGVRLSGFDIRTTPELDGEIASISPDLSKDATTGAQYYTVRVDVPDGERDKLPAEAQLVPGMPAEIFFETGERSVLSYLLGPLNETLLHMMRESN